MSVGKLLRLQYMGIEPCVLRSSIQPPAQVASPTEDQAEVTMQAKPDVDQTITHRPNRTIYLQCRNGKVWS